jgi:hypothetical protein
MIKILLDESQIMQVTGKERLATTSSPSPFPSSPPVVVVALATHTDVVAAAGGVVDGAVARGVAEELDGTAAREDGEDTRDGEVTREGVDASVEDEDVSAAANKFSLVCHARNVTVVFSLRGAEVSFLKSKKVLICRM